MSVAGALREWIDAGRPCVLATVVASSDSAPRGLGAQLAIGEDLLWIGGLSGGCAETEVLARARELFALGTGDEARRSAVLFEMTKNELGASGPVCGATLQILAERMDLELLEHPERQAGALHGGQSTRAVRDYALGQAVSAAHGDTAAGTPAALTRRTLQLEDASAQRSDVTFTQTNTAATFHGLLPAGIRLVIGGAGDVAIELIALGRRLGWRTVLVDPRGTWVRQTTGEQKPDQVVSAWPEQGLSELGIDSRTACITAAHDEKLDLPFLVAAVRSPAFYVGSIGSRRVQAARSEQLERLVGAELADRHTGPAGLDLGGSGAAEIALSIVAEVLASWNRRTGRSLVLTGEPIRAQ